VPTFCEFLELGPDFLIFLKHGYTRYANLLGLQQLLGRKFPIFQEAFLICDYFTHDFLSYIRPFLSCTILSGHFHVCSRLR
jgi:hypothetical protein